MSTPDPLAVTGQRPYRSRHGIVRWSGPRPVDVEPLRTIDDVDGKPCPNCERIVVAKDAWLRLPVAERRAHRETHCSAGGWGMCGTCYAQAKRDQERRERYRCGSRAAYQNHRRLGEEACDDCIAAERAYQRARRLARKNTNDLKIGA